MAYRTDDELTVLAANVANETAPGANSATRIGGLFGDLNSSKQNLVQDISEDPAEGVNSSTTRFLIYGLNIIDTSFISDFCARLPQPKKGRTVTVINTAEYIVRVFPFTAGGKINGVVDGHFDVPANSLPYSFTCYENPLPGDWSTPLAVNAITDIPEMSVAHVNGSTSYFVGTGTALASAYGVGLEGTPYHMVFTPPGNYWKTESTPKRLYRVRVATNIVTDDFVDTFGTDNLIQAYVAQGYMTASNSTTYGVRGTIVFSKNLGAGSPPVTTGIVTGGPLNSPAQVGDIGTYFGEMILGDAPEALAVGTGGQFSNGYYILGMQVGKNQLTKTYKFKFEVELI